MGQNGRPAKNQTGLQIEIATSLGMLEQNFFSVGRFMH